jgi:hypothetical protein
MSEDRSSSVDLFRQSALDLAQKLSEIGTAEAMGMAREARELAETFKGWEKKKPENDVRIAKIQQLFALNRRVMDFLSQRTKAKR